MNDLVIIEAALNGVTPKTVNANVPRTPEEIGADALRCLDAGAAIVHTHNSDFAVDADRAADLYLESWRPVLSAHPAAILYPTIGFGTTIVERYAHHDRLASAGAIRMGIFDPGSVNLGAAGGDGLPAGGFVYVNTFDDVRHEATECERLRLGPSISIFEPGFLRTALAWYRAGKLAAGGFVKLYFGGDRGYFGERDGGASFGLPPTRRALDAYLEMLAGTDLPWAVAVLGGDVVECGLARLAIERGGHVRVGLEDYGGQRRPANADLVKEVVSLARELGRPAASIAEAAAILRLPR